MLWGAAAAVGDVVPADAVPEAIASAAIPARIVRYMLSKFKSRDRRKGLDVSVGVVCEFLKCVSFVQLR